MTCIRVLAWLVDGDESLDAKDGAAGRRTYVTFFVWKYRTLETASAVMEARCLCCLVSGHYQERGAWKASGLLGVHVLFVVRGHLWRSCNR